MKILTKIKLFLLDPFIIIFAIIVGIFSFAYQKYSYNPPIPAVSTNAPTYSDISGELFTLTNSARATALTWDNCLAQSAVSRAEYIYNNNNFSHTDLTGKEPYSKMVASCFPVWTSAGENITEDEFTADSAQNALMNSPEHKANILGNYSHIGIGCYKQYCDELFANVPSSQPIHSTQSVSSINLPAPTSPSDQAQINYLKEQEKELKASNKQAQQNFNNIQQGISQSITSPPPLQPLPTGPAVQPADTRPKCSDLVRKCVAQDMKAYGSEYVSQYNSQCQAAVSGMNCR